MWPAASENLWVPRRRGISKVYRRRCAKIYLELSRGGTLTPLFPVWKVVDIKFARVLIGDKELTRVGNLAARVPLSLPTRPIVPATSCFC